MVIPKLKGDGKWENLTLLCSSWNCKVAGKFCLMATRPRQILLFFQPHAILLNCCPWFKAEVLEIFTASPVSIQSCGLLASSWPKDHFSKLSKFQTSEKGYLIIYMVVKLYQWGGNLDVSSKGYFI